MLTYYPELSHPCTSQAGKIWLKCAAKCTSSMPRTLHRQTDFPFNHSWGASSSAQYLSQRGSQLFWLPPGGLVARRGAGGLKPDLTAPCKKCARHSELWCQRAPHNLRCIYCMSAELKARKRSDIHIYTHA